ncbi:hypothetical protein Val02_04260 [Virgisporangium aliadipatigenens]|uniref:histidine kinase n=1 Tax=Virgisporangium aliadipatigenens TaxID=741659 RepID=A0A8J4DM87_9ACTN|nr:ATP-binding protein [Virgisporangium aliadipatigenens]GIJ43540.1 hypothetical protein Val02_04260 [Virgisporangium aliadipatigenens]
MAARDVHDIVAHSLAVVIVQADAGRYAAGREREVLATVAQTARAALADVYHLIDLLRDEPERPDALHRLVGTVRTAGLDVRLDARPSVFDGVPAPVRTAALRVVRESLTNVLKHAGPDGAAEVTLRRTAAGVSVRVADRGATARPGTGHGITGMRERVTELGGTFEAGPQPGGFLVEATVPAAAR